MKMAPHPATRRRHGQSCRRRGRRGDRGDAGAGARRGREGEGRLRGAAGGRRSGQGQIRAADPRGGAEEHDLRMVARRPEGDGGGLCRGQARHQARHRQQSPGAEWPIEPRAALAEYDAGTDHLTLWNTSQNPHVARLVISAFVGITPEHKLRVIAPDVGGGFGSKIFIYPEEVVCLWAARKVRRPVKWTADRSEAFLTDAHGRDHVTHAELALDGNGKILALRAQDDRQSRRLYVDLLVVGADLSLRHAAVGPVRHSGDLLRGGRGLHQHRAGRRASRRRTPGGDLRRRTARGSRGAPDADRADGIAQAQFRQVIPAPDAGDHGL